MPTTTIGLLHPGEMGSAIGQAIRTAGGRVLWSSEGRSARTEAAAVAAGLDDVGSLASLVAASEVIVSVCPPHAAFELARQVAALGFRGLYVDANAVSPSTVRRMAAVVQRTATFVDGGIIGLPPKAAGTTRLYVSGASAARAVALFTGSLIEAIAIEGGIGAASALKMAYAAWTKGSAALLMAVRGLALSEGVDSALLAEWQRSLPELPDRSESVAKGNARKAWRFVAEMEEIAAAFSSAGLPDGFHRAAGEIYRRLEGYKDAPEPPSASAVVGQVVKPAAHS